MAKFICGLALCIAGVVLGVYLGVWVCFIGGIIQLIHGITPEVVAKDIAFGIARIFFSGGVGWFSAAVLIIPGMVLMRSALE